MMMIQLATHPTTHRITLYYMPHADRDIALSENMRYHGNSTVANGCTCTNRTSLSRVNKPTREIGKSNKKHREKEKRRYSRIK